LSVFFRPGATQQRPSAFRAKALRGANHPHPRVINTDKDAAYPPAIVDWGAWRTIAGYEAVHMIRTDQACWSAVGATVGLLHRFIVGMFGMKV